MQEQCSWSTASCIIYTSTTEQMPVVKAAQSG